MKSKMIATLITLMLAINPVLAAYDLGDYPDFLFTDHNLNTYVVAGSDAATADVVGMTDLAVRLAGESYEEVSSSGVSVTGGKSEEMELDHLLNESTYFGSSLDDDDLAGLQDAKVSMTTAAGTEEYDIHDELRFTTTISQISVETALTTGGPDEDFKDNVFLEIGTGSVGYYFVFDDTLKTGYNLTADVTSDYPLELEFLGNTLTITDATTNSITAQIGNKQLLKAGESVTVESKTITLDSTTSSKAIVSCGGTTKAVAEGSTASLCGLQVLVDTIIDDEGTTNDQAILVIGTEATKTYTDGDPYIGQDEDDPDWVWDIGNLETYTSGVTASSIKLGILYDQTLDEADEVINLPGTFCLPEEYICIDLNSFVEKDYQLYTIEPAREDLYVGTTSEQTSAYVLRWHAAGGGKDGFALGSQKTDDVLIWTNSTGQLRLYYKDTNDNKYKFGATVNNNSAAGTTDPDLDITFKDSTVPILFGWYGVAGSQTGNMTLSTTDGSDIIINIIESQTSGISGFDYLGSSESDTTYANDLRYGTRDISSWEEDLRAADGIIILDPKAHLSGDSFDFNVNGDESDFKVNVIITGPEGGTTTGGDVIKKVVPVTNTVAKLDTEISLPVNKHLVLVGGPGVNELTAQAMGLTYPTYGSSGLLPFGQGEGYIKVFEDTLETGKVAVVVAGWEAGDTRNACSVLQKYTEFASELGGNVAVKVTSVTAAGISPAT